MLAHGWGVACVCKCFVPIPPDTATVAERKQPALAGAPVRAGESGGGAGCVRLRTPTRRCRHFDAWRRVLCGYGGVILADWSHTRGAQTDGTDEFRQKNRSGKVVKW